MKERDPDDGMSYPRWTVIGSVPTPHCLFSLSVHQQIHAMDHRFHDGLSCTTVLVFRDPFLKGLQLFLSILLQISKIDRHTLDGPYFKTFMTVRDPSLEGVHSFSKCPLTDIYDGPSYPRWSALYNRHDGQRPLS